MLMLLTSMFLASCMVGPEYHTPRTKVAAQWSIGQSEELADAYWWHSFNDPVLSELIELAGLTVFELHRRHPITLALVF